MKNNKTLKYILIYIGITFLLFAVYYFTLPPLNLRSGEFWIFLTLTVLAYVLPFGFTKKTEGTDSAEGKGRVTFGRIRLDIFSFGLKPRRILLIALVPVAVLIFGNVISSTIFNARRYASVIDVREDCEFKEDLAETVSVEKVALMDSQTAKIIGQRELGELRDSISQYKLVGDFNQINYGKKPKKVANLEYGDFFKWASNRKSGIPGYIMVDPVDMSKEYRRLSPDRRMKYVDSAYFGDDLGRRLRFAYPTKIFGKIVFEVDDEGNPYFIVPCLKPKVAMFGAPDVYEVILFDPCTGDGELLSLDEVPTWVDIVFYGDLAMQKYNWYGVLSGGWINSLIVNKDCKRTTDDYGYIMMDDDVWYYTGVTSVNDDKSNIGFIISNARTGEYKFYPVIGAEEHSAMGIAEGVKQNFDYKASFPVLINVEDQPTYIMVLTDANKIVKSYALVNVMNYNTVSAVEDTIDKTMLAYKKLLAAEKQTGEEEEKTFDILIESIDKNVKDGDTVYYFKTKEEDKTVYYKLSIGDDESVLFIEEGMTITVTRMQSGTPDVYVILSWHKKLPEG